MFTAVVIRTILIIVSFASARGLHCNEGFNATVLELPFYQWQERDCHARSDCFSQEMTMKTTVWPGGEVTVRYGGCISAAYAPLLSCESLFGPDSNLDPAVLLNVVASRDDWFERMTVDFEENAATRLKQLFSNGKNAEEFIEGAFNFDENLGFNMQKAYPLKKPLAKLFSLSLAPEYSRKYREKLDKALKELLRTLGTLDTKDPEVAAMIYSFLGNFLNPSKIEELKTSEVYAPIIENVPGLYKSMLPPSWDIDIVFEILGAIKMSDPRKSTADVIKTIKARVEIPENAKRFLDPFFNAAPKLVQCIVMNDMTCIGNSSVSLLKEFSRTSEATRSLSNSVLRFAGQVNERVVLPPTIKEMITWLPGLFYQMFPADEIDRVYNTMAVAFDSFDRKNVARVRQSDKTKLSEFLIGVVGKVNPQMKPFEKKLIISFSKMFYDLMTAEYKDDLDIFFTTLNEGFQSFPNVDPGQIITNYVTKLGGTIPAEVEPLLKHAQEIMNGIASSRVYYVLQKLIADYRKAYPDSEFPKLAGEFVDLANASAQIFYMFPKHCYEDRNFENSEYDTDFQECIDDYTRVIRRKQLQVDKSTNDLSIDLIFALFNAYDSNEMVKASLSMDTTYFRLIKSLNREDVKDLVNDFSAWEARVAENASLHDGLDNFIYAINASLVKITSKIGDVIKDLRRLHAPESCKFQSCTGDLCNTHGAIEAAKPFRRSVIENDDPDKNRQDRKLVTEGPEATTSGASEIETTLLLNIASLWLAGKIYF